MNENTVPLRKFQAAQSFFLAAFAFTSVASIAMQNFIWVAVALSLAAHYRFRQKFDWPHGPFALATLLFTASFFIGAFVGIDTANSFHTVHKYLTILLFFLIGAMPIALDKAINLLSFLNYGAAICAVHGLWKHFWLHQDRIDSFSGDKMVFGGMLMICLLFQLTLIKFNPRKRVYWPVLGLIGFGLLLTETRGAWLGFACGFFLLGWRFNRKWLMAGLAAALIAFFFMPVELQQRVSSIWSVKITFANGQVANSTDHERPLIWQAGWNIVKDHPWGIGQGNLGALYPKYKLPPASEPNLPHLHDNYLQILAQNGWEGFLVYLFWIASFFVAALRWKPGSRAADDLNWTFLCAFSAVLVWGLTEYTFSHQFMNFQFFLLGLQAALWRTEKA